MAEHESKPQAAASTLSEDDISTTRTVGRRSAMAGLGGALLGTVAVAAGMSFARTAEAQVTDSDTGRNADAAGRGGGRGDGSDSDTGQGADPVGRGRRGRSNRRCSDSDSGQWADAAGRGTRC